MKGSFYTMKFAFKKLRGAKKNSPQNKNFRLSELAFAFAVLTFSFVSLASIASAQDFYSETYAQPEAYRDDSYRQGRLSENGIEAPAENPERVAKIRNVFSKMANQIRTLKEKCSIISTSNQDRLEATARFFADTGDLVVSAADLDDIIRMVIAFTDAGHLMNIAPDLSPNAGLRAVILPPPQGKMQPAEILIPGRQPLPRPPANIPERSEILGQWLMVKEALKTLAESSPGLNRGEAPGQSLFGSAPLLGTAIAPMLPGQRPQIIWQPALRTEAWAFELKNTACDQ